MAGGRNITNTERVEYLRKCFWRAFRRSLNAIKEREIDGQYYHSHTPIDDRVAKELRINPHDIPRINTISPAVDWTVSHIIGTQRIPQVVPEYGQDERVRMAAEYRLKQVQSCWQSAQADRHFENAVFDAAVFGEGVLRLQTRLTGIRPNGLPSAVIEVRKQDWRGILPDRSSEGLGFQEGEYFFNIKWVDVNTVKMKHPRHKSLIDTMTQKVQINQSPVSMGTGEWHRYNNPNSSLIDDPGQDMVLYGLAWWREKEKGTGIMRPHCAPVLVGNSEAELYLMEQPHIPFQHQWFPYVGITANIDSDFKQPYSRLVRGKRGNERTLQYTLRQMIDMSSKVGVIASMDAIPRGADGEPIMTYAQFLQFCRNMSSNPAFVLLTAKMGELEIHTHEKVLAQLAKVFELLITSSQITGDRIDPSLLGQTTNISAGVALQEKEKSANLAVGRMIRSSTHAIQDAGQIMLAMIEEYESILTIPQFVDEGGFTDEIVSPEADTILDNRFHYRVTARASATGHEEKMLEVIQETIKIFPEAGPALMSMASELANVGDAGFRYRLNRTMKYVGARIPPHLLPPRERQAAEQAEQAAQESQQEAEQLGKAQAQADISKTQAEAEKNLAQGEKAMAEAEQISRTPPPTPSVEKGRMSAL